MPTHANRLLALATRSDMINQPTTVVRLSLHGGHHLISLSFTNMHYYKTTIQYEGTNYSGFQWQKGFLTVQSELNDALSKILIGSFSTMSTSRTDSGVHALDQIVKITSENEIELLNFVEKLNHVLPPEIKCLNIFPSTKSFRPAAEAISKEYRYFFTNKKKILIEETQFITNISNVLNVEAMLFCAKALVGTHDFCNFYSEGSNVKSTVRNVTTCDLSIINPQDFFSNINMFQIPKDLKSCFELRIVANGFLKQMIRHIISALWMVGTGKISTDEFINLLNGPKVNKQMWKVAKPNGLFLYKINYHET